MNSKLLKVFFIVLVHIIFIKNIYAQQKDSSKIELKQVVISANKNATDKKDIVQSIQIISKSDIQILQSQTSADLLANTPGIFVQKSQMGGGSPVIRGFEANRIVLMVDGMKLNNLIYRGGHLQNCLTMNPFQVEKIEVLMGPSSTQNGSDALGGSIHYYTPKIQFKNDTLSPWKIGALMRVGTVNHENTFAFKIQYSDKKWFSHTSVIYSRFDDLMMGKKKNIFADSTFGERNYYVETIDGKDTLIRNANKYLQKFSEYSQYNILQKIGLQSSENSTHELSMFYTNSSNVPRYDRLTNTTNQDTLRFAEWYYGPQELAYIAYHFNQKHEYSFFQKTAFTAYHQSVQESRNDRTFNSPWLQQRNEKVKVWGANFNANRHTLKSDLTVGVEGILNSLKSTAKSTNILNQSIEKLDTRYPDGENQMNSISAFVFHIFKPNNILSFNEGFRIGYSDLKSEIIDTTFFKFDFNNIEQKNIVFSGNIGVAIKLDKKSQVNAGISSGFRVPNIDDLSKIFETNIGLFIVPNENLKPEKTINYELNFLHKKNNSFFNLSLFYVDYFDRIITDGFTYKGQDSIIYNGVKSRVVANQNKERAYIYGVQGNLQHRLSKNLNFTSQFSTQYGRIFSDSTETPLDHIPPMQLRAGLEFNVYQLKTLFFVDYQNAKKLKDYNFLGEDNYNYAPKNGTSAWMTWNIKSTLALTKQIFINAGVENILDTQYRTFSSGINAPGRNFYISLSLNP